MQGKELVEHGLSWKKLGEFLMGRKFPVWEFTASGERISRGIAGRRRPGSGADPFPQGISLRS
jgi:hypothetical protein